jgi:hypothetical protein
MKESMRSEQLVNSVGCKIIWHFPAIAYLVFSEGGIGKMSSPKGGRVRFARSEVGSDGIQADAFGTYRTTLVWYP